MAKFALAELLEQAGMTINDVSRESGLHPYAVRRYRDGLTDRVTLAHIDPLCRALSCGPGDLIVLDKNGNGKRRKARRRS